VRALRYDVHGGAIELVELPVPVPEDDGAVLRVLATGVCRSDWHGWRGHDAAVVLPQVPGHEYAGEVVAVGSAVRRWSGGERVVVPFVCACGSCPECARGAGQVCRRQRQPGFGPPGSFAEYVAVPWADTNLVALPAEIGAPAAAALGCRFATAWRALTVQGRLADPDRPPGEWVVVVGLGGVGLAATQIASAHGARVLGVDRSADALAFAARFGVTDTLLVGEQDDPAAVGDELIRRTDGGAALSVDAIGSPSAARAGILGLRRSGRHVQVGLLPDGAGALPMDRVISRELTVVGSHGLAASDYPGMLDAVRDGLVDPAMLVTAVRPLEDGAAVLAAMDGPTGPGVSVLDPSVSLR